jgi:hypothetical protein
VRILFADQPLHRGPPTAGTFAAHPLQVTGIPHILRAEGFEIGSIAQLNMIVISLPGTAWRLTAAAPGFV